MSNPSQDSKAGGDLAVKTVLSGSENATLAQERRDGRDGSVYTRRRRLLAGGAAGAGVFLAMQAKTALGGTGKCESPSAHMSGNLSHHPHNGSTCSGGRSPGFWKQPGNFNIWPGAGLVPPTFKSGVSILNCSNGLTNASPCDIATRGTLLNAIFAGAPAFGVWEVLVWPTNYPTATGVGTSACVLSGGNGDVFAGKGQLLRHLASAYLNAGALPKNYPITQTQVIAMWNAVKNGGAYCPTGPASNSCAMTAAQIIDYISNMYDTGIVDDLEGCKKN